MNSTVIKLSGRIDSKNSAQMEQTIIDGMAGRSASAVVLDASGLEYISSAGLRVILRLKKKCPDIRIINVNPDVYEILEMTGFTEIITVEKAYRVISVDGCEEVGRGANGIIYRIDQDNVVKVYENADALDDICHEREMARLALILGIPTAISYDVVRVGDGYGSVFELLNARSFSKILATEPDRFDWCVNEFVALLKKIHGTSVPDGKLPDVRGNMPEWIERVEKYLPDGAGDKLRDLISAVPDDSHMIHGDYHTKNVMLQDDEVLLIDMDTLSVGNPIFEFAFMFNAFVGYSEIDRSVIKEFQGFDFDTGRSFWRRTLAAYLGTECGAKIREVEDKARIIGYTRILQRSIRRGEIHTDADRKALEYRVGQLISLLERTDTLCFSMNELELEAAPENLDDVQLFVRERLSETGCSPKALMHIELAAEEIFVNIANYAYTPDKGNATVRVETGSDPVSVTITFIDRGIPYDPLAKRDPDVKLPAEKRDIGGLGVFVTKKLMDDVHYEYRDGQNILSLKKNL